MEETRKQPRWHICRPRPCLVGCLAVAVVLFHGLVFAQKARLDPQKLGVDVVTLKDGPQLLGAVIERAADGTATMAVRRAWLKQVAPAYYARKHQEEITLRMHSAAELPKRMRQWIAERADDKEFTRFLETELARVERTLVERGDSPPSVDSQLMILKLPAVRIRRTFQQPAERKHIVLLSWQKRLADVESRTARDLANELKRMGIVASGETVDLFDRVPDLADDERQWAARRAIFEYELRRRIDFQGNDDLLVRVGDGNAAPDLSKMSVELLQGQIGREFSNLLGPPQRKKTGRKSQLDAAQKVAEKEHAPALRVTRVSQNLAAKRVSVESRFLARMPDGSWQTIWKHVETADTTKKRPELMDRIKRDPRIGKVLDLFKAIGGQQAEKHLAVAIQFGAATMEAQQNADDRFYKFRDRYLKRLDGPPLYWSRAE